MSRRNPDPVNAARGVDVRAMVGVIAAGLLLGGVASMLLRTAGEWFVPDRANAQSITATGPARARAVATPSAARSEPAQAAAPAPAAPHAQAQAQAARPAGAKPAAAAPAKAKAAAPGPVVSPAHLDDQVAYQYNALGRRDPFQSLLTGEYVGADLGAAAPPDVGGLKVVGIVWGDGDQFALVEDARGDSHILRRGDKVMNGYVETLMRDAMIVNLTLDGQSQSVRVPLTRKGEKSNANR
jgi:hypothetical protein